MNIVTYRRDLLGRFVPSKRKVFKLVAGLVVIGSFILNYWSLKELYNFRCKDGGGFVIRKTTCNDLAEYKMDAQELYRLKTLKAMAEEQIYE